jgi:hypothetical protein
MYLQSLRFRIFAAMSIIVVLALVFTGVITWYQYQEQSKDYHTDRLERKEQQVLKSLENELNNTYLAPLNGILPEHRLGPVYGDAPKAACKTCHQGYQQPLQGTNVIGDWPELASTEEPDYGN